jgi:hypothetical protein
VLPSKTADDGQLAVQIEARDYVAEAVFGEDLYDLGEALGAADGSGEAKD